MRPAYLADAALGDRIRFQLPSDLTGGTEQFEGTIWWYDKQQHATGVTTVSFVLSGHCARGPFTCAANLHIDLEKACTPTT